MGKYSVSNRKTCKIESRKSSVLWKKASNPQFERVKLEEYIRGREVREINSSVKREVTYLPRITVYQALGLEQQSSAFDYGKTAATQI